MDFNTVMNNPDGGMAVPLSGGSIDYSQIPTAQPPPGFNPPPAAKLDPFARAGEDEEIDKFVKWLSEECPSCGSAEELLLKSTAAFGCGEKWFADAVGNGFPIFAALQFNPGLIADMIRNTNILDGMLPAPDWATGRLDCSRFWSLLKTISLAPSKLGTASGAYEVMKAYFEKVIQGEKRFSSRA